MLGLAAASCTSLLGIDEDYHKPTGGASGTSSSGAGGSTSAAGAGGSASSSSSGGSAAAGVTCATLLKSGTGPKESRVYSLDPDCDGGVEPFKAYCEMVEDGGGWTLALKIDGKKATFEDSAEIWEISDTYQADFPELDETEAKLASFSTIQFSEMRLGMIDGGSKRWIIVPIMSGSPTSLAALFAPPSVYVATSVAEPSWRALVASPSLQKNCKRQGFNVLPDIVETTRARVRIGIIANDQATCDTPASLLGFGADKGHGGPSGNYASFNADQGDRATVTFGYVMVR